MSDVELSETCRCGASTTVKGMDRRDAQEAITAWRGGHLCIPAGSPAPGDPQRTGAGSTIGFAAPDPWRSGPGWLGERGPQA